jgi:hypothetical protein
MVTEEIRKGKFTASGITRLLAEGTGKTRITYIIEVAKSSIGLRNEFSTSDTAHGINNQINAFDFVVKNSFESAQWCDKFIPINDDCGASPDVVVDELNPLDIKCPTNIDNYLEQISDTKNQYYYQVQMQMMALDSEVGYLCYYLTRKEEFGMDWKEYDMPLEDRFKINTYHRNPEAEDKILSAVEKAAPLRDLLVEKFLSCDSLDEIEFFYEQKSHGKFRKLSYSNNPFNVEKIYRVGDEFYYKVA